MLTPPAQDSLRDAADERLRRWPLWQVACLACAFLLASGILDGRTSAHAADAETTDPDEGEVFTDDEDITFTILGDPKTDYTLTLSKTRVPGKVGIDLTTDSGGEASSTPSDLDPGDYVLQLRAGHNNKSGKTLDTISFTVKASPESGAPDRERDGARVAQPGRLGAGGTR